MKTKIFLSLYFVLFAFSAHSAVVGDILSETNPNRELSRAEKKCINNGYKITYANCENQTAPTDQCPHHPNYFKSCSKQQWCWNSNFRLLAKDCVAPEVATGICNNEYPLYNKCEKNIAKACEDAGFSHSEKCQITDKKCPYSEEYGKCCDDCPNHPNQAGTIPTGYLQEGEICITCAGEQKIKLVLNPCQGFELCQFGPEQQNTPSCQSGKEIKYSACREATSVCESEGYINTSCQNFEDETPCPQDEKLKKCQTNCRKLAELVFPNADIIAENITNPEINPLKNELRSLSELKDTSCHQKKDPIITLNLNSQNIEQYQNILNRDIRNINFKINFEEPLNIELSGKLHNVDILFSGAIPECVSNNKTSTISGVVQLAKAPNLCNNFIVSSDSKLATTGSIKGNIEGQKSSQILIYGNLEGSLKTDTDSKTHIKGELRYTDDFNTEIDTYGIILGCNSQNKIDKGVYADTTFVALRENTLLNTPKLVLRSTSDMLSLPNLLSGIHLHSGATIAQIDNSVESSSILDIASNQEPNCQDRYYIHLGSAIDSSLQENNISASSPITDGWKCKNFPKSLEFCH